MSFLRHKKSNVKPDYTSLEVQTSTSTLPIPLVWGKAKLAGNLIWFNNFRAIAQTSGGKGGGKGGGGGGTVTGYTYYADLIIALCEGPISLITTVWQNQGVYTPSYLGLGLAPGSTPQTPWSYVVTNYPAQALGYPGVAYAAAASFNLGETATIGNLNFEVLGPLVGTGVNNLDADPAQVIYDFLTNAQYGVGFDASAISGTALFGSGGDASLQTYCKAMGIAFSPTLTSQEQASSVLGRWLQILSCAAVWSGGLLKFIPYGDSAIASGATTVLTQQFTIPSPVPQSSGYQVPSPVTVAAAALFVSDGGVVFTETGAALTFIGASNPTVSGTYGMTPAGTYIFAFADEGKPVRVTYTIAAATAYAPNLTPVYALTDSDFVVEGRSPDDPVHVERADVYSLPTIQRVEVVSRSNRYAALTVEARDQSQIELYGARVGPTVQAHEICDEHSIGPIVAQMILQRALYVRTRFAFTLSAEYCLLDPMDVVTITDSGLGLSNYPVRIVEIEEDDKGNLKVTAEELVVGVSTPGVNPSSTAGYYSPDQGVPAVPVNAPLIYEPSAGATGGTPQLWVGASPITGGSPTQWGGCYVWVSLDNASYSQIAEITAPLRQGFLTASLASAFGWDIANTLSVDLSESVGTLTGTSDAAAQAGATLCLVDTELLAYANATLTSAYHYNLTHLERGVGGASASHASGAPFARIDGAVVKYTLPSNLIGQTIYLKFQSFNAFGGGLQDISTCTVYSIIPAGAGAAHPVAAQLESGFAVDLGLTSASATVFDDFGSTDPSDVVTDVVELGTAP